MRIRLNSLLLMHNTVVLPGGKIARVRASECDFGWDPQTMLAGCFSMTEASTTRPPQPKPRAAEPAEPMFV